MPDRKKTDGRLERAAEDAWEDFEDSLNPEQRTEFRNMFRDGTWVHGYLGSFLDKLSPEQRRLSDAYWAASDKAYDARKRESQKKRGYREVETTSGTFVIAVISIIAFLVYSAGSIGVATGMAVGSPLAESFTSPLAGFLFLLISIIAVYSLVISKKRDKVY
jgi:hypothetical protein